MLQLTLATGKVRTHSIWLSQKQSIAKVSTELMVYVFKRVNAYRKKKLDESGVEPKTFHMRSERATNCATRPLIDAYQDTTNMKKSEMRGHKTKCT